MVEFGQYPLVYQLQNGIPVGLAESTGNFSGVSLVVSSISATEYLGLTGTGSITIPLPIIQGGTGATGVTDAQINLELQPGVDVQVQNANLQALAGATLAQNQILVGGAAGAITTISTPSNSTYLKYTTAGGFSWDSPGGSVTLPGTQFAVLYDNGSNTFASDPNVKIQTGVFSASNVSAVNASAQTFTEGGQTLVSKYQPYSSKLVDIAGLSNADNNIIVGDGTNWVAESGSVARTSLGLGGLATANSIDLISQVTNSLPIANGGTGATTNTNARSNLGLGTTDNPQFNSINIGHASDTTLGRSGAGDLNIEGNVIYRLNGTDVAVADGGTGASTESQARINLGLSALATASSVNLSNQVTNTLPITNGGTGQTTATAALNALLPPQSTHGGKYLKTDGTNTSWDTPAGGGSWTSVFKTADQAVVGLTETDDNTLTFSIDANSKYSFRMQAQFDDGAFGYKFAVSSGINPGLAYTYETFESVSKTVYNDAGQAAATIPTYSVTLAGSPGYGFVRIVGLADNSSGGATAFKFKFCSGSAGKTAYTKAGSYLEYKKL